MTLGAKIAPLVTTCLIIWSDVRPISFAFGPWIPLSSRDGTALVLWTRRKARPINSVDTKRFKSAPIATCLLKRRPAVATWSSNADRGATEINGEKQPLSSSICEEIVYDDAGSWEEITYDSGEDDESNVSSADSVNGHEDQKQLSLKTSLPPPLPPRVIKRSTSSGLVTRAGGALSSRFKHTHFSPLDRIVLTASGTLQRIFSSYYDAPVHVHVEHCTLRNSSSNNNNSNDSIWDRRVYLSVHNHTFCTATSVITVHSAQCVDLVQFGQVGIGQLFRHLDKLPKFTLLDAGRMTNGGGLWREYELKCPEVTCWIREELIPNIWEIRIAADTMKVNGDTENTL